MYKMSQDFLDTQYNIYSFDAVSSTTYCLMFDITKLIGKIQHFKATQKFVFMHKCFKRFYFILDEPQKSAICLDVCKLVQTELLQISFLVHF